MITFNNNCDGGFLNKQAYLNVFLTPKCENNCIYCVAKKKMNEVQTEPNVEKIADTILSYGWNHVVISGGEPLLYPEECEMLIDFIRPYIKDITMFTALPGGLNYNDFKKIISKLDGTNISIRHYDYLTAHKIAQKSGYADSWRIEFIRRLIKDNMADKFRLSLELCKGYLDTEEIVKNCLVNFYAMGVKNIKLSELNNFPELFVPITQVLPGDFKKDIIYSGCSIPIKSIPQWGLHALLTDGRTLLVKRTCALIQPKYKITKKDKLKLKLRDIKDRIIPRYNYRIILPNGELINQW
jgi:pyruvate-formate lyase-activating enzyme